MSNQVIDKIVKKSTAQLGKSEAFARALVHSSFDISDKLYDFAGWVGDDSFTTSMDAGTDNKNGYIK